MSKETPTFDPSTLPDEETIRRINQADLELLEQGITPSEIVALRVRGRKELERWFQEEREDLDA